MNTRRPKSRPESWGAIRKLPSGRYQASYVGPDAQRHNAPHTFDAIADARAWLAAQRVDIQRGTWKSPAALAAEADAAAKRAHAERFETYARNWVEQRRNSKGQALRAKTRTEYLRQLGAGLAVFADDALSEITPARVRAWHAARAKTAPTAAGAEARLLSAIMRTAVVDGIVAKSPVPANLTRTKTGRAHRPPTLDELGVLHDTMPAELQLAVLLAAYGSLRLGEWRALRRSDLALMEGRYMVSITRAAQYVNGVGWVVNAPKSDEGVRVVPLPASMTSAVEQHLTERVGPFAESLLFAPGGRTPFLTDRDWTRAWDAARDAAGVRAVVREHDLRAFAATMHARSGATLRETQKLLGHSTVAAAMQYQHATEDRLLELADRMPLPSSKPSNVRQLRAQ